MDGFLRLSALCVEANEAAKDCFGWGLGCWSCAHSFLGAQEDLCMVFPDTVETQFNRTNPDSFTSCLSTPFHFSCY